MRIILFIPCIIIMSCKQKGELPNEVIVIENEIDQTLDSIFSYNNNPYFPHLISTIENYLIENEYCDNKKDVGLGYLRALQCFTYSDDWPNNKIPCDIKLSSILNNIKSVETYNPTDDYRYTNTYMYSVYNRITKKYTSSRDSTNANVGIVVFFGAVRPGFNLSPSLVAEDIVEQLNPSSFERPAVKKTLIWFYFIKLFEPCT